MTYRWQTNRQTYRHLIKIFLPLFVGFAYYVFLFARFFFYQKDSFYALSFSDSSSILFSRCSRGRSVCSLLLCLRPTDTFILSDTLSHSFSLALSPSQHACCQNYSLPSVLHVCSYHVSNPTCNLLIVRFFFFFLLYYVLVPLLPTHPTWFIAKILLSLNASRYFRKMTVVPRNYRVQW